MMFDILFPIADHVMNPFLILAIGVMGGVVAGMFGIGGGVVVTPILVMVGIPPMIAVASQLHNAVGTNLIGFMGYWRQRDVDFALAWYLFLGGIIGACGEIFLLEMVATNITAAEKLTIIYLVVLGLLGSLMLYQNIMLLVRPQKSSRSLMMRRWMIYFPLHRIFTRARVEMSILIPICVGIATGLLTSTFGGGNSLLMMPIVYYLIGRSSPVVAGTTILAAFAISIAVMIAHGFTHSPSDWLLAFTLLLGSAFGSQVGIKFGYRLKRPYLGILGAIAILLICSKFAYDFYYLGASSPVVAKKNILTDVVDAAILTTPDWGLWMVKLAYNHPFKYAFLSILGVIFISLSIERFICRFIIIKR